MDKQFNQIKFRPAEDVETTSSGGFRLYRQLSCATYMALDENQSRLFDLFDGTRTVQDVLQHLLADEGGPDIRQFYELVLHAQEQGFLIGQGDTQIVLDRPDLPYRQWRIGWRLAPVLAAAAVLLPAGGFVFVHGKGTMPISVSGLIIALLTLSLTFSLANLLAGCVLSGYKRFVYSPGLRWAFLAPYWGIDLRDTFMGGRYCQAACAVQMLVVPCALAALAYSVHWSNAIFGTLMACILLSCPFGDMPGHELLHAVFRRSYSFPKCGRNFLRKRLFAYLFRYHMHNHEEKYLMVYSLYTIGWLALLIAYSGSLLGRQGPMFMDYLNGPQPIMLRAAGVLALCLILTMLVAPTLYQLILVLQNTTELISPLLAPIRESRRRVRETSVGEPGTASLKAFLKENVLFSQLPDEALDVVTHVIGYAAIPEDTAIVREGDPGNSLFLIHSGKVAISKTDENGTERTVAVLGRGDAFGEIALLEGKARTASAISVESCGLLILRKRDFDRLLLKIVGAEAIRNAIQITAFLQKQPMCASWPEAVLADFAKHFTLADHVPGEVIITAGQANRYFYIVYEGECTVRRQGKPDELLCAGEFFGEISLMQAVPATATVIAGSGCRCLRIEQDDFFRFVSRDIVTVVLVASIMDDRIRRNR